MKLTGKSIIGFSLGSETAKTFTAYNPKTGRPVEPDFFSATNKELNHAVQLADRARIDYGRVSPSIKAEFLRQIAKNIESLGDLLVERATLETGLPNARFQSERGRTCAQLRLFADHVEEGSWVDARIDFADPNREPLPKPDIRSMLRPIGPVAVFCASNFPLAFSVAGGDTASALAAGCPVIVNAHSAHPGTAELVGKAVSDAVETCKLQEGVFSLLFSSGYETGQELVKHELIKAVGFTGSQKGGRALMDIASARKKPIPVYAEMSSVNPIFVLPGALVANCDGIVKGLHGSITLGVGQFCTKPGVVVLPESKYLKEFSESLKELANGTPDSPLLTSGIQTAFNNKVAIRNATTSAEPDESASGGFFVSVSIAETDVRTYLNNDNLSEEIFGPAVLLVKSARREELIEIAKSMEGQLTATIHGSVEDLSEYADLIEILETKVGRLIFNGFPTGVEVSHSMVHGGSYPATSDSRSTSVGTRAIERFTRLVCYQDFPEKLLHDELKDGNPLEIWRMVEGEFTRE